MKFLHLSDLHIGKTVNGFSMLGEQRHVFGQIIGYIDTEKPDAVLISGDVYDRAVPSVEAVRLFDDLLTDLAAKEVRTTCFKPYQRTRGGHEIHPRGDNKNMKKIVLVGDVACGKTTLCQSLNGFEIKYEKTQTLNVINCTIDTPGECLEHRHMLRKLTLVAADTDLAVFIQDATREQFLCSPGQTGAFPVPVIGVVSKADLADEKQLRDAKEMLEIAGAEKIFTISVVSDFGMDELVEYLKNAEKTDRKPFVDSVRFGDLRDDRPVYHLRFLVFL